VAIAIHLFVDWDPRFALLIAAKRRIVNQTRIDIIEV